VLTIVSSFVLSKRCGSCGASPLRFDSGLASASRGVTLFIGLLVWRTGRSERAPGKIMGMLIPQLGETITMKGVATSKPGGPESSISETK
jgi:hypothetical protein